MIKLTCASGVQLAALCKAHGGKASMWSGLLGGFIYFVVPILRLDS